MKPLYLLNVSATDWRIVKSKKSVRGNYSYVSLFKGGRGRDVTIHVIMMEGGLVQLFT